MAAAATKPIANPSSQCHHVIELCGDPRIPERARVSTRRYPAPAPFWQSEKTSLVGGSTLHYGEREGASVGVSASL